MRLILVLLLCVGCSVSKFYRAPEVAQELKKNAIHLDTLTTQVERDFSDKQAILQSINERSKTKSPFVMDDLKWRLKDMEEKKETILSKSAYIKEANNELLHILSQKKVVKEGEPEFKKIVSFSSISSSEGKELINDYQSYRTASEDFIKFALFTSDLMKRQ